MDGWKYCEELELSKGGGSSSFILRTQLIRFSFILVGMAVVSTYLSTEIKTTTGGGWWVVN